MDSYFTCAEILNHIDGKQDRWGRPRGYVGDLKSNRKLEWKGLIIKANNLAASIPASDRKEMRIGDRRQWYFTVTVRIPDVKHKVRIVILWRYKNDADPCKILVTPSADDNRRGLSGYASGKLARNAGLGNPAGDRGGAAIRSCDCPIGAWLTLQNSSYNMNTSRAGTSQG
jgi:hypothetical protein